MVLIGWVFSRRQVEWEAASNLIEGICLTLQRQPIISFLPHLRSLINVCVNLVWKQTDAQDFTKSLYLMFGVLAFICVLSGDGCGGSLQRGRWASSSPPQPLPIPSAAVQHSSGPTGCPADPGQFNSSDSSLDIHSSETLNCPLSDFCFLHFFLVLGLEGGLSSEPCDLTFHQSGEARGDAAQPAHSLCAHCRLWKQR